MPFKIRGAASLSGGTCGNKNTQMPKRTLTRNAYMRSVSVLLFMNAGLLYGVSPLVLPVAMRFTDSSSSYAGGIFLYGFAIFWMLGDLITPLVILTLRRRPNLRFTLLTSAILSWPLTVAVLALAVHVISVPLFFFAFVAMSYPASIICLYLLHAELSLVWGDEITVGNAIAGASIGFGAFFWTVSLGELTELMGAEHIAAVIGIHAATLMVLSLAVVFTYNPACYVPPTSQDSPKTCAGDASASGAVSFADLMRDWRAHVFVFVIDGFTFCGLSMKMLLTTIFEEAMGMTYIQATRMSAFCLLAYMPGRGLTPFFATNDRVFGVFIVVLGMETAAYAISPWAISFGIDGRHKIASFIVYSSLRLISGGGFAILLGNIGVLARRVFGKEKVVGIVAYWTSTEWIVGVGPSFAWAMHVESASGDNVRNSFNSFFLICSCIAGMACAGVICLAKAPSKGKPHDPTTREVYGLTTSEVERPAVDAAACAPCEFTSIVPTPSSNDQVVGIDHSKGTSLREDTPELMEAVDQKHLQFSLWRCMTIICR